jgi:hypothetical protein
MLSYFSTDSELLYPFIYALENDCSTRNKYDSLKFIFELGRQKSLSFWMEAQDFLKIMLKSLNQRNVSLDMAALNIIDHVFEIERARAFIQDQEVRTTLNFRTSTALSMIY